MEPWHQPTTDDADDDSHFRSAFVPPEAADAPPFDDSVAPFEVSATEACSRIDELQALLQMHVLHGGGQQAPGAAAPSSVIGVRDIDDDDDRPGQAPLEDLASVVMSAVQGDRQEALHSLYSQKELVFLEAALQPMNEEGEANLQYATSSRRGGGGRRGLALKPGARNSSVSTEPQSVAARQRRGRIREKLAELQGMVPGGGSMDTAALLEEAATYVAFLQAEVQALADGSSRLLR
ncbi:hypothetical protein L7F22_038665 [Adiantum nelumboides]|nr:hypothetical protein [Adiantum nelumboides]